MLSARSQGEGVYAVLGGVTTPHITDVTPSAATNDVATTLTIVGGYYLWPVEVVLVGPTGRYTLPMAFESVGPHEIVVEVPAGLPARE
jgi:cellobiose-specific phosphotransferase system component IIB